MPQKNSWRPYSRLAIGEFVVDTTSNEISSNGVITRLRPILMDVLLRLATDAGVAVNRENLLNDVWQRRMVNDEVLSRAVAELRTALGDDPKAPRYIETLPKVGYRLVALVVPLDSPADRQTQRDTVPEPESVAQVTAQESVQGLHVVPATLSPIENAYEKMPEGSVGAEATTLTKTKLSPRTSVALLSFSLVALAAVGLYVKYPVDTFDNRSVELERRLNSAVPFATSPQSEASPRFSPDGKMVVFVRSNEALSEIVIQSLDGGSERTFSVRGARLASPVFFPNGKQVAYWIRRTESVQGGESCAIAMRDLDLATDTELVDCQQRPQPVFDITPDGHALVYSALSKQDYPLALMKRDLQTQTTRQLTSPMPGDGHDAYPRVSPDGKTVAFFRGTRSHARPWMLALNQTGDSLVGDGGDKTKPEPVSRIQGLSYGMAWLPQKGSSDTLVAAADWLGFRALNGLSIADGSARLLGARGARFPDVAKDGSIVFETATFRADLWLTSAAQPGEGARMRWPSTRYTSQPQFSPDGRRVVFASNRSGGDAIHVASIDEPSPGTSDDAKRLSFPENARYIQPRWSSDGSAVFALQIAVKSDQSVEQRVVVMNLASGAVSELAHLGHQVHSAMPLENGVDLVYGEIVDHSIRLLRVPIAGGSPTRLPLPLVSSFAVVGNELVYTQPQLVGATRCELDTLKCAPIQADIGDGNRFDWTLGKGLLWYVSRTPPRKPELIRLDLRTGEKKSFDFSPSASGANIAASADGQWLLLSREAPVEIDLMIARSAR